VAVLAICCTVLVTLPVNDVARDKNDETPFAGDVGALVVLLPRKLRDKSDDCDNE
jgi:hypothetical protein